MKERAQVNDSDELIDTDELKSSSEGVYIRDRILRCNKALQGRLPAMNRTND